MGTPSHSGNLFEWRQGKLPVSTPNGVEKVTSMVGTFSNGGRKVTNFNAKRGRKGYQYGGNLFEWGQGKLPVSAPNGAEKVTSMVGTF